MRKIRNIPDVGRMNKKIKFQHETLVSDGGVGSIPSWTDFNFSNGTAIKWAHYNNDSGMRYSPYANRMVFVNSVIFTIQFDNEVANLPTAGKRIVYPTSGNNVMAYKIEGINLVGGEKYFLKINCTGTDTEAV